MILRVFLLTSLVICGSAYKVLVVYPMPMKSHSILGDGIVSALSKAGHEVTYITPFTQSNSSANVRKIDVSANREVFPENDSDIEKFFEGNQEGIGHMLNMFRAFSQLDVRTLENNNVQELINDTKEQFDVAIIEWMFHELLSGLSVVFNCPYIWVSSINPHWRILQLVDQATNPAYSTDSISVSIPPLTFVERAKELAFQQGAKSMYSLMIDPLQYNNYERLLAPVIQKRGYKVPPFDEVKYNGSLVLSNSHVSYCKATTLPPNFIPIGGYHINGNLAKLPEKLQEILDNAEHGVIYFSMGSHLKSKFLPKEIKEDLLKVFGALKYSVIWKFEEELPGTPSNVHITQWAPQHTILAHPKCVLFITHGGLLSISEVIHFGKPVVVIPVFADQFVNAKTAVQKGFGILVELSYTMVNDIRNAIDEILKDSTYSNRAKELSAIYHDRIVSPDKELVYWVEHVVKTGGAPHLRSSALGVMWYQKLFLDLAAVLAAILIVSVYIIRKAMPYLKKQTKPKKRNRNRRRKSKKGKQ